MESQSVNLIVLVGVVILFVLAAYAYRFVYQKVVAELLVENQSLQKVRLLGAVLKFLKSFQRVFVILLAAFLSNALKLDWLNPVIVEVNDLSAITSESEGDGLVTIEEDQQADEGAETADAEPPADLISEIDDGLAPALTGVVVALIAMWVHAEEKKKKPSVASP